MVHLWREQQGLLLDLLNDGPPALDGLLSALNRLWRGERPGRGALGAHAAGDDGVHVGPPEAK